MPLICSLRSTAMHNEQLCVWQQSKTKSHLENLRVTRLDLLAHPLDASGIVHNLISSSRRALGFSLVSGWTECWRAKSTSSCCASSECSQFWNRRAAFGFGAELNTALGPVTS